MSKKITLASLLLATYVTVQCCRTEIEYRRMTFDVMVFVPLLFLFWLVFSYITIQLFIWCITDNDAPSDNHDDDKLRKKKRKPDPHILALLRDRNRPPPR